MLHHHGDVGTLLAIFAHPDDEAYLAGGLMALAADAGRRVVCVTATRGEMGFPDDDPRSVPERIAVREAEMAACLEVLGVQEHHWLDQPDGGCHLVDDAGPVAQLCELIEEVGPDTVVAFGPDGQTFHDDHIATSRWTTFATRRTGVEDSLLYACATPEWAERFGQHVDMSQVMMVPDVEPPTTPADELALWFRCDDDLALRKVEALRCQESQTAGFIDAVGVEIFCDLVRDEMFRRPTAGDWA